MLHGELISCLTKADASLLVLLLFMSFCIRWLCFWVMFTGIQSTVSRATEFWHTASAGMKWSISSQSRLCPASAESSHTTFPWMSFLGNSGMTSGNPLCRTSTWATLPHYLWLITFPFCPNADCIGITQTFLWLLIWKGQYIPSSSEDNEECDR